MTSKSIFYSFGTITLLIIGLIFFQHVLIPLVYAGLIAMTIYPITKWLKNKDFSLILCILLPLSIVILLFVGLVYLLSYELVILSEKINSLKPQILNLISNIQQFIEDKFLITNEAQFSWFKSALENQLQNAGAIAQNLLHAISSAVLNLVIIPIYVFLILLNRNKLVSFVLSFFEPDQKNRALESIKESIHMFARFIKGMFFVYLVVGLLNTLGLWILGVEHAFFYGILAAVMTIIPYVGIIISGLLPISLSWVSTGQPWQPLGIIVVFTVVQYLEANIIFPYIVGKQININTLVALVTIFAGAIIWGVSGMILFLPIIAIIRIFSSHFNPNNSWALFLGNDEE